MPGAKSGISIGLGLRSEFASELLALKPKGVEALEVAPENYLGTGGLRYHELRELSEHYPILFHGLTLSLGSLHPLSWNFLKSLKKLLREFKATHYSDHLCYSSLWGAMVHDLLPLPFCEEAARHVAQRIRQVQDMLELPFALENISYYADPSPPQMREWEFLNAVLELADCQLLLDVNNIYVNSVNHGFDPYEYLRHIPYSRVRHLHVAGHQNYGDMLLDNHGAPVRDEVWEMLRYVLGQGVQGTVVLERDNRIPALAELLAELEVVGKLRKEAQSGSHALRGNL